MREEEDCVISKTKKRPTLDLSDCQMSDRGKETVCVDAAFGDSVHTLKAETLTRSGAFNLNCAGAFNVMKQNFIC